jgi:beta-glucosidase
VLLKNKNLVLPLPKDLNFVYMVGPLASNELGLVGNYNGLSPNMTTIVEGITRAVEPYTRVEYRQGVLIDFPNRNPIDWYSVQSREADATVCVVGFSSLLEGEEGEAIASATHGDNPTMKLPQSQIELVKKLANEEKPVVLVVCAGSPVDLTEVEPLVDAILYAWYPGEAGGMAVADIIFGNENPSGKLPITFPKSVDQLPPFNDYSLNNRTYRYSKEEPMYPFGFGLNYSKIKLTKPGIALKRDNIEIDLTVQNSATERAEEVLQLYVQLNDAKLTVPQYELKAIKRISLEGNTTQTIKFKIPKEEIFFVDQKGFKQQYKGSLTYYIGNSSPGKRSKKLGAEIIEIHQKSI